MNREILIWIKVRTKEVAKKKDLGEEEVRREIEDLMNKAVSELEGSEVSIYPKEVLNMIQQMRVNTLFDKEDLKDLLKICTGKLDWFIEDNWSIDKMPKDVNGVVDLTKLI